jgi:hypothetical protein
MRPLVPLVLVMTWLGCAGSAPKGPDAANFCKGSAYDPCNDEHGCPLVVGAACQPVGSASPMPICTQSCTAAGSACPPDATGAAGQCVVAGGGSAGFCASTSARPTCTPIQ